MTGVTSVMVVTGVTGVTGWAIEGKETVEEETTGRKKEEKKEGREERRKRRNKEEKKFLQKSQTLKNKKMYRSDMAKHGDGTRRNVTNQVLF